MRRRGESPDHQLDPSVARYARCLRKSSGCSAGSGRGDDSYSWSGTLNDNNPLILVDGIEFPLEAVNPNDIESISVLKDAASSAIYGSRAAMALSW